MKRKCFLTAKTLWAKSAVISLFIFFWLIMPAFAVFEGTYSGTATGDASGTWSMEIGSEGDCMGSGYTPGYGNYEMDGYVNIKGEFTWAELDGDVVFTGTISSSGNVSGTWMSETYGIDGSFSGTKENVSIGTDDSVYDNDSGSAGSTPGGASGASDDESNDDSSPCGYDLAGQWTVTTTNISCDCPQNCPSGTSQKTATVTQNGCSVSVTIDNKTETGILDGMEIFYTYTTSGVSDANIPWTQTFDYEYQIIDDDTLQGTIFWRHDDIVANCGGEIKISATKGTDSPASSGGGGGGGGCFIKSLRR